MSELSTKLGDIAPAKPPAKRGPTGSCEVYGTGTLEDWRAVNDRRCATSWTEAQIAVDLALGITKPIKNNNFRYHWSGKCSHFDAIRHLIEAER